MDRRQLRQKKHRQDSQPRNPVKLVAKLIAKISDQGQFSCNTARNQLETRGCTVQVRGFMTDSPQIVVCILDPYYQERHEIIKGELANLGGIDKANIQHIFVQ